MGRGKTRSYFTRFAETHHRPTRGLLMGFAKISAFETRLFLLYPILRSMSLLELIHQRAAHRVTRNLYSVGLAVHDIVLAAEIVVQIFEPSDPVPYKSYVEAAADAPAGVDAAANHGYAGLAKIEVRQGHPACHEDEHVVERIADAATDVAGPAEVAFEAKYPRVPLPVEAREEAANETVGLRIFFLEDTVFPNRRLTPQVAHVAAYVPPVPIGNRRNRSRLVDRRFDRKVCTERRQRHNRQRQSRKCADQNPVHGVPNPNVQINFPRRS